MENNFMLEPDIIEANTNVMPDINEDLVLAKNYLKTQSAATGDSLYDHLVDLVQKILTHKPPNSADNFEQISWMVKREKFKPNFDLVNDLNLTPAQLEVVHKQEDMFKVVESKADKLDFDNLEEQELDLEEDNYKPKIADLIEHNYYFREGGYGLSDMECYSVFISLKLLAARESVATIRFFGKIFGLKANYYVAETDLTIEELDRRIREFDMKDMPGEGEGLEEAADEQEQQQEEGGEGEHVMSKEPVPPKLPAVPKGSFQPTAPIPVERPGQGVNKKVYWVCNVPGDPWVCLPDVTPDQIRVARLTVRCMTGDLNSEVLTYPPFDGTERNYLRAQIGRIAASTSISPQGFYTFGSGEEEEDIDMEEGGAQDFNQNPFYQGHTIKDLLDPELVYWVHHGRYILPQGRTLWWNTNAPIDEAAEEEDDDILEKVPPEIGPHLMTPLANDSKVQGTPSWTPRCSSYLAPDRALVTIRSNVWPGAFAYATNGKNSECMYVGWGLKYQPPNFTPLALPKVQEEYVIGPEIMEMADPTFADEEVYRIAHLPPAPPPELLGEGEGDMQYEGADE